MDPDTDRNPGTPDRPPERERAIVAAKAAERALAAAGVAPEELDIIILGTSSRTGIIPAMPAVFRRPSGQ